MSEMSKMFPDLKEVEVMDRFSYGRARRHNDVVLRPQDEWTGFVVGEYHGERKALAVFRVHWHGDGKFYISVDHNPEESVVKVDDKWTHDVVVKPDDDGKWPDGKKSPKKDGYLSEFGYQEP